MPIYGGCPSCGGSLERHELKSDGIRIGIQVTDCEKCGHVVDAIDERGEFRRSFLRKVLNYWRKLKAEMRYLVSSLALHWETNEKRLVKLFKRTEMVPLDGKSSLSIFHRIKPKHDEKGNVIDFEYIPSYEVLKDMDPEEGEPWPYDVHFLGIESVSELRSAVAGEDLEIEVRFDYCFTSPAEVFFGLPNTDGNWSTSTTDVLTGEGAKTVRLVVRAPPQLGDLHLEVQAHVWEEENWHQADSIPLDLAVSEFRCTNCRRVIINNGLSDDQVFRCPHSCGQYYRYIKGEVEPLLKIGLGETWGLAENSLQLALTNMQDRNLRCFIELAEDGTPMDYGKVELEPMQSMELKLPPQVENGTVAVSYERCSETKTRGRST